MDSQQAQSSTSQYSHTGGQSHQSSASVEEEDSRSNRPGERFSLGEFSIDENRPIKVIVIGAGFSGIIAGIRYARS